MKEKIEVWKESGKNLELTPDEAMNAVGSIADRCVNNCSNLNADELHELSRLAVILFALPQVQQDLVLNLDNYLYVNWDAPDTELHRWFKHPKDVEAFEEFVKQMGERHEQCTKCKEQPEPKPVAEKVHVYEPQYEVIDGKLTYTGDREVK